MLLEADHLSVSYDAAGPPALDGISLRVPEGSLVTVAGASGCGKSTLLQAASGIVPHLIRPARLGGEVRLAGTPMGKLDAGEVFRRVGVVLQSVEDQLWDLGVEDCIAFPLESLGCPREKILARMHRLVEEMGLGDLLGRRAKDLSGGEKRMVAIASALAHPPDLLVLDEPSGGLDPGARGRLRETVSGLKRMGQTILVAEQDLSWLLELADDAALLTPDGRSVGNSGATGLQDGPAPWKEAGLRPPPALSANWRADERTHAPSGTTPRHPPPGPGAPLLELEGLVCRAPGRRRRGGRVVLSGLDLCLREGEVAALIGPNGAGKTTLLRRVMGLAPPEEGRVLLGGEAADGWSVAERARRVGYVPQNPGHMFFATTLREEVAFSLARGRGNGSPQEMLARFGLDHKAGASPFALSFRELQRLALACVEAAAPSVLFFDEPLVGWDERWRGVFVDFLRGWKRAGRAALLATHDLDLAGEVADRVVLLVGGEVASDGPPDEAWGSQGFLDLGWPAPYATNLPDARVGVRGRNRETP